MSNLTFDVLSTHEVRATFQGTQRTPCHFRTALCPDRCGHSAEVARFTVDSYIAYTKDGQYGDDKQEEIYFTFPKAGGDADANAADSDLQPEAFVPTVKALQKGDQVIIRYEHRYMKDGDGSQWPTRPFTKLERVA